MAIIKHQANKRRYTIAHLLVFTTLLALSGSLMVEGVRLQSPLFGFGLLSGLVVLIGAIVFAGAILSSRPGAIRRVAVAIALISLVFAVLFPMLFPLVR